MRDARSLAELELLAVARLYGLEEAGMGDGGRGMGNTTSEAVIEAPVAIVRPAVGPTTTWQQLREMVRECQACGLARQRKQAVFGVGAETAPWMFVGEGPGADEDERGEPFVGQAGKLLDNMLAAIGIRRGEQAYIANVVKCRPPGNRTPTHDEAQACSRYLERQVALLRPKLIVALGKTSANHLLANEASIASLRGQVHHYQGVPLVVTYHPAYLLRTPADKSKVWEDLLFARRTLAAA